MSLLGAVSGIVGAGINYLGQQSTNEANLNLAKMQNDWNLQMWERNNSYNSPSAQVQRLIEAGINPLGQNFTSYQSSPVQSADMANQQAPQLDTGSIVQGFQGDRNLDIQEKLADADVKLKQAQELEALASAGGKKVYKEVQEIVRDNLQRQKDDEHKIAVAQENLLVLQGKKVYSEKEYQDLVNFYLPYDKHMNYAEVASRISLNQETEKDIRELRVYKQRLMTAQTADAYASAEEHRAGARLKDAQTEWTKEDTKRVKALTLKIAADTNLTTYEAKIKKLDYELRKEFGGLDPNANREGWLLTAATKGIKSAGSLGLDFVGKIYNGIMDGLVNSKTPLPATSSSQGSYNSLGQYMSGNISHRNP